MQRKALIAYGVPPEQIVEEKASGKSMNRKALKLLMQSLRPGDVLVVWKLDRLGRTLTGVLDALETIEKMGVHFVSLTEKFDTSSPMGKAFLQFAMVMAELERNLISERTKAGIAARKLAGQKFGRRHAIRDNAKRIARLRKLDQEGKLRDADGELLMPAHELVEILNQADKTVAPITNPETVRRYKRSGYPGLDPTEEEPLVADDD